MGPLTRKRRASFLLFELLCSLTLLTLVLFPLVRSSMELYRTRKIALTNLPHHIQATQALAQVKEKLYLQEIPFSVLEQSTYHDTLWIEGQAYEVHLRSICSTHKPSLHKKGLLVSIDLYCNGVLVTSSWCFIQGEIR